VVLAQVAEEPARRAREQARRARAAERRAVRAAAAEEKKAGVRGSQWSLAFSLGRAWCPAHRASTILVAEPSRCTIQPWLHACGRCQKSSPN
jgi:hypothetical protein